MTEHPAIAKGEALDFAMPAGMEQALAEALAGRPGGDFQWIDGQGIRTCTTYEQVWEIADRMLAGLRSCGCAPGDVLILDAGDVVNFVPALWASLRGGMTALPMECNLWNPQSTGVFQQTLDRVVGRLTSPIIVSDNGADFDSGRARRLSYEQLRRVPAAAGASPPVATAAPAVLIQTSGTTGAPQLVTLSPQALMHRWWPEAPGPGGATRFLGWMPLDHVMGLGIASPNHMRKIHVAPELFVRNPSVWLDLVEEHGVTHAVLTNFSLKLIVAAAEAGHRRDLSSLKRIGVGAEMISGRACAGFVQALVRQGMSPEAVILGYGLAECGPVAGGQLSFVPVPAPAGPDDATPLPIDRPTPGHAIRIVGEDGGLCKGDQVGAIQVTGPTMTSGYAGDPASREQLFTPDNWIRTGDLGYLRDGILSVTGREKEVLNIHARKFSCYEIDATICRIPGITFAHVFAFRDPGVDDERVGLVYGTDPDDVVDHEPIIRKACVTEFGLGLTRCQRVDAARLPRTNSGKLQRHQLAVFVQAFSVPAVDPNPRPANLEDRLRHIMRQVLPGANPQATDNFLELGGDSFAALRFTALVEAQLGGNLPPAIFLKDPTCRAVAKYIQSGSPALESVSVLELQRGDGPERLFLAPGRTGANAYATRFLAGIGTSPTVWTAHVNRRGADPAPIASLADLARDCCLSLRRADPQGPYYLAGYSFGAYLAFEMARHLIAGGSGVGSVLVFDATANLELRRVELDTDTGGKKTSSDGYSRLLESYVPGPLRCSVRYYRARDSENFPCSDPTGGWSYLAQSEVEVLDLPSSHADLVRDSTVKLLAGLVLSGLRGEKPGISVPPVVLDESVRTWIDRGRVAAQSRDWNGALAAFEQAVSTGALLPYWVHMRLSAVYHECQRVEDALAQYRRALELDPCPLTTDLMCMQMLKKQPHLAREAIHRSLAIPVNSVALAQRRAMVLGRLGEWTAAGDSLRQGLELVPNSLDLRFRLVEHLLARGCRGQALEIIATTLAAPGYDAFVFRELGKLATGMQDLELAAGCFQRTMEINPKDPQVYGLLADVLRKSGFPAAADRLLGRFKKSQPQD